MSGIKNRLAEMLERIGSCVFGFLSRWEERGVMPRTARWLRLGLLGIFVATITALSAQPVEQPTCYVAVILPEIRISEVTVSPDSTKGADSVTVRARAGIFDARPGGEHINSAWLSFQNDTTRFPMAALDGKMNDTLELFEGSLYVGNLEEGLHWIGVYVTTSTDAIEHYWAKFTVCEPDSLPGDSTLNKEEQHGQD